jgi:hypothetical protein
MTCVVSLFVIDPDAESGKATLPTVAYMLNDARMWDLGVFDSMPESRRRGKRPEGERLAHSLKILVAAQS